MQQQPPPYQPRYVPVNTNQGWGAAALTILLALACIAGATVIHKRTYKPPTDPSWHAAGNVPAAEVPRGR